MSCSWSSRRLTSSVKNPMHEYSEDALIERPTIALFGALGWETANCYAERFGAKGTLGRETPAEVVLLSRLRAALERLNPDLSRRESRESFRAGPGEALALAIAELTRDRSALSPAQANREVYALLKEGVKVTLRTGGDGDTGGDVET